MRINLTSVEESNKAEQIKKIIKSMFPDYTVTVIKSKYATKKGREEIKAYRKAYHEKNREEENRKKRERDAKKREEKRKLKEQEKSKTEKKEKQKKSRDYER